MTKKDRKEYLSVEEFAEKAGVGVSTIYRHMKGKLSQYILNENGKKWLSSTGLELYRFSEFSQNFLNEKNENDDFNGNVLRILQKTIDNLENQMKIKDRQIEQLTTALMNQQVLHKESIQMLPDVVIKATEPPKSPENLEDIETDIFGRPIYPTEAMDKNRDDYNIHDVRELQRYIEEQKIVYENKKREMDEELRKFEKLILKDVPEMEQAVVFNSIRVEGGKVVADRTIPEELKRLVFKLLEKGYSDGFNEARPFWKKKM